MLVAHKLPFTAAAVPAVSAARRHSERRWFDQFNNPRLGVCFLDDANLSEEGVPFSIDTEFTEHPICHASRTYQNFKLKSLKKSDIFIRVSYACVSSFIG